MLATDFSNFYWLCSILKEFCPHGWCSIVLFHRQLPYSRVYFCLLVFFFFYYFWSILSGWIMMVRFFFSSTINNNYYYPVHREAMIPCILLALGGNLVEGKIFFPTIFLCSWLITFFLLSLFNLSSKNYPSTYEW